MISQRAGVKGQGEAASAHGHARKGEHASVFPVFMRHSLSVDGFGQKRHCK